MKKLLFLLLSISILSSCKKEELNELTPHKQANNADSLITFNLDLNNYVLSGGFRIRKNQEHLTETEWAKFINALKALKASDAAFPDYYDFASCNYLSKNGGQAMYYPYSLPWQREHLLKFEERLRRIDPTVSIPYWDFTTCRFAPSRLGLTAEEWGVSRSLSPFVALPNDAGTAIEVHDAMYLTTYMEFLTKINQIRGEIHQAIGGQMANYDWCSRDVLYWLVHAYLDKLWSDWQSKNPSVSYSLSSRLTPYVSPSAIFTHTGNQVIDKTKLYYTYDNGIAGIIAKEGKDHIKASAYIVHNYLPVGSIVLCKTAAGKYAKLKIVSFNSPEALDMTIQWVCYNLDGSISSQGTSTYKGRTNSGCILNINDLKDLNYMGYMEMLIAENGALVSKYNGPLSFEQLKL